MLKINLLPSSRREAAAPADLNRNFAIAMAAAVTLAGAGLFLFHASKTHELEEARRTNAGIEAQTRVVRGRIADHRRVLDELAEIRAREEAIEHLEAARTGPTAMLVELSHLLSPGGQPTADPAVLDRIERENAGMMFNRTWDTHRVWLTRFAEDGRNVVIQGDGRTPEDVGEFMRRLILSQYFEDVRLERSEGATDERTRIPVQRFRIAARVRY